MSVITKKIDSANASLSGNISREVLNQKVDEVIKKIAKGVKIDGFRKGKVPANLIKSRYKDQIDSDSKQEAIRDLLDSGLKELGITPNKMIGNPLISKFDEKGEYIEVEIKISTAPEFSVDNIQSCIPQVNLKPINQKQIDERIEEIAKSRAPLSEVNEKRGLKKDDVALIDFEGFVGGKAFEGGKAQNFSLTIGSNQFIAGFEDALIGMKKGEERTIDVRFPDEYQAKELAGKDAQFKVKLHTISQKQAIKIDDEFAKSMLGKDASVESLNEAFKEQLEMEQKTELYNKELKGKLLESLLDSIKFDLPELIIEQEMDILFRNALAGVSKEEFESLKNDETKAKQKRESLRDEAKRSVQATFIIDALARKNNITINDNEVLQTVYYEAMMMGQDAQKTIEYYRENNILPAIKMAMIEDRVLHFLLDSHNPNTKESNPQSKSTQAKKPKSAKSDT
ncbi:trigger factor [Helicobacter sp. 23-1046]